MSDEAGEAWTDGAAGMAGLDPAVATPENYRRFARQEAAGRSPAYEQLAYAVAEDPAILAFLSQLPDAKRQPNLLFAAAFYLLGAPPSHQSLRRLVADRPADLATVMATRRTQTNEAARCATLLPALALLPGPLALLEVGASAGLTLLVDRYSYDYGFRRLPGADPDAPTLSCRLSGPAPVPAAVPEVVWRAGLDLNPLDAADPDDARWLRCLLWPGEAGRSLRLDAAMAAARRQPLPVHCGDLLDDLPSLAGQAPAGATLVVYHSAVLAYVDPGKRRAFAAMVGALGAAWIANEAPGVVAGPRLPPPPAGRRSAFALTRDGEEFLGWADPHGSWLEWAA